MNIRQAIERSIFHDEIAHADATREELDGLLSGSDDYRDLTTQHGYWDVWGTSRGNNYRVYVRVTDTEATMTTIETLTNRQIAQLQQEAAQAGDALTVNDCAVALGGYDSTCTEAQARRQMRAARERIVKVLNDAEAQNG